MLGAFAGDAMVKFEMDGKGALWPLFLCTSRLIVASPGKAPGDIVSSFVRITGSCKRRDGVAAAGQESLLAPQWDSSKWTGTGL